MRTLQKKDKFTKPNRGPYNMFLPESVFFFCMSISEDGGNTWNEPEPIVGRGGECWKNPGSKGNIYRSPWPMFLKDGRILVVFAHRCLPMGIGGVISTDDGKTWSEEFVIRDDAICNALGYPVGCQALTVSCST